MFCLARKDGSIVTPPVNYPRLVVPSSKANKNEFLEERGSAKQSKPNASARQGAKRWGGQALHYKYKPRQGRYKRIPCGARRRESKIAQCERPSGREALGIA